MAINAVEATLLRNMTRLDVIGKYTENLKEKLVELMEEHAKEVGPDNPTDCVPFHISTMNIIANDIIRLIEVALEDFSNPTEDPKP